MIMETYYDLKELRKITRNDSSLLANMLGIFIKNCQDGIRDLNQYLREENWKNIGETAHKILPSFRHLEVHSVVNDLVKIKEKTIITGDYRGVPELVSGVIDSMSRIVTLLKAELKEIQHLQ
jgi:hypothetical protein